MRTLYDEIRSPRRKIHWGTLIAPLLALIVALGLLLVFHLYKGNREAMNWVVDCVTTPLKRGMGHLCDYIPFGVAEVVWAIAIAWLLFFLIRTLWLLFFRGEKLLRLIRRLIALTAIVCFVYVGYTLLWGVNYYADDFSDLSGIQTRGASVEELATLNQAFVQELNRLADGVERDENGVFCEDLDAIFDSTQGLYDAIEAEFPFLAGPERRAKQMIFSPLMSRLDFTGFYFPFTGESLLNVDAPSCLIPATILHEFAHQRNIAPEDECNFVAIVAGLRCDNTVYRYSSALMGYIHLGNALYSISPQTYYDIRAQLDSRVNADLASINAYWDQFSSKLDQAIESVGTTVYENFLQSYGQTDGMKSYGKCVDLLVAYYFDHKWAE